MEGAKSAVPSGGQSFWSTCPPASSKVRWKPAATSQPKAKSYPIIAIFLYPRLSYTHLPKGWDGCELAQPGRTIQALRLRCVMRSEEHTSELQSRPHLVCR